MTTFERTITPAYEQIGRRQRLTGFIGQITDEAGVVLHSQEYSTNSQAETALNAIVYDLLSDYTERGLIDPVLEVNWNSAPAAQVDPPTDPLPDDGPGDPIPGDPGYEYPRAVTLTSIQIEATIVRNRICANCQGPHFTWRCPEIGRALFAPTPWSDPELGHRLCQMRWRDFERFRKLLSSVTRETLLTYAASYQAYIRTYQPDTDLTISQVLAAWAKVTNPAPVSLASIQTNAAVALALEVAG